MRKKGKGESLWWPPANQTPSPKELLVIARHSISFPSPLSPQSGANNSSSSSFSLLCRPVQQQQQEENIKDRAVSILPAGIFPTFLLQQTTLFLPLSSLGDGNGGKSARIVSKAPVLCVHKAFVRTTSYSLFDWRCSPRSMHPIH